MSPLILTADQRSAVDGILRDIQQPGARVVLCGYAGTGKTVTTAALVTRMQSIGMNVAVATPTHKAKIQVERALRERGANGFTCTTLHALLGLKPSINSSTGKVEFLPDFGKDNKLSHRQTKEFYDRDLGEMVEVSSIDIVIVDESSMVNEFLYQLLLKEADDRPVVFVGDDRQLLPVKEDKVCRAFVEAKSVYRLDEVLRHDGAILNLATATRHLSAGRAKFTDAIGGGSRVASYWRREQWMESLLEIMASNEAMSDPDYCRALAHCNRSVEALNKAIHVKRYGASAPRFVEGMTCVTVDAVPDPILLNGSPLLNSTIDVLIKSAAIELFKAPDDEPQDSNWKTWVLDVEGCDVATAVTVRVIHEDDAERWKASQKKIANTAKGCTDSAERKQWWEIFWHRSNQFGKLQPASALTVHKSQGSTFRNVFLHWDIDGWGSAPSAQQNQLAYVGITRASESLHVIRDR